MPSCLCEKAIPLYTGGASNLLEWATPFAITLYAYKKDDRLKFLRPDVPNLIWLPACIESRLVGDKSSNIRYDMARRIYMPYETLARLLHDNDFIVRTKAIETLYQKQALGL